MCGYKCVAEWSYLCVGIPLVFNMCVWVQGFSVMAWFLSHISKMKRQSYYTMESCLHGTAASMVRLNRPGYSLDRHVTKPGIWFMGQFRVGRESVLIHLPLLLALMGYSKLPYSEHLDGCTKIKFWFCSSLHCFMRLNKVVKRFLHSTRRKVHCTCIQFINTIYLTDDGQSTGVLYRCTRYPLAFVCDMESLSARKHAVLTRS